MKKIIGLFLLLFIIQFQLNAQSYELKYDFQEGKTYLFSENTENDLTQSMMGNEMKIKSITRNFIRVTAEDETSRGTLLNVSLDSAYASISMPMKDTSYNIDQLIGKRISILLSPEGEVLEREIIDTVDVEGDLTHQGNREAIQFLKFLPDKKVSVGESWIVNHVDTVAIMGGGTTMTSEMEFTVAGTEERDGYNVLKIPFTGKIMIEGEGSMMGFKFFIEGSGTNSGDFYFAPEEGLPIETILNQFFDITMAATGDQNMIIPITQEVKTTRKLVK
jgi:hypothetical protein